MFYLSRKPTLVMRCIALLLIFLIFMGNVGTVTVIALDSSFVEEYLDESIPKLITSETAELEQSNKAIKESPLLFTDYVYQKFYTTTESEDYLNKIQKGIDQLNYTITSDNYTLKALEIMNKEVARLEDIKSKISANIIKIVTWENEYPYATKTWQFLIKQGYSEIVASAIIGNMMIETSGGELCLNPIIYDPTGEYYGLCQWSLYHHPEVRNFSFEEQLEYLVSNIEKEFKTFGKCYREGFGYEDFLLMNDPASAAHAFAIVYERCNSASYSLRKQAAKKAYEYFSLDVE